MQTLLSVCGCVFCQSSFKEKFCLIVCFAGQLRALAALC